MIKFAIITAKCQGGWTRPLMLTNLRDTIYVYSIDTVSNCNSNIDPALLGSGGVVAPRLRLLAWQ